ncbi:tail length tape measure protein [Mycobacterium phage ThetaBob]|uniref:Tape measure protein n=1 Tax=Mycobacterium phage ThetaBob TaxID=2588513 RepID=A0A4Y6EN48_9CAUD|nr:tail length tape measure protein [Mycobacterium phage ThetaBob]QDF19902.1 tape measure protein [Mycobacterium phage ThetaBob]
MPIYVDVISRLDERAAAVTAAQIERRYSDAGRAAGTSVGRSMNDAIDRSTGRVGTNIVGQFDSHGANAGRRFGTSFNTQVTQQVSNTGRFNASMAGYESAAGRVGSMAGRALGLAFTTAAGGLIGVASLTLFKGFQRYQAIDAAKNRLENLNKTLESTGRAGLDVGRVMDTVTQAVTDTPFALDQAFSVATRALASNTGDLKRFMTVVTDAAGFAGAGVDEIGDAFLKIANTGKVSMEEIGNQLRNIPILPWLQQQLGVTGSELQKMISDGKVGLEDLMKAVEANASGFAKASGETIEGAMSNLQTSVARVGANFLGAIFGKPTEDGNQLVDVLKTLRERIDDMGAWVTAHQDDIREFFQGAVEVGKELLEIVRDLANALGGWENLVKTAGAAFVAWKTIGVMSTISQVASSITTMGTDLDGLPGKADRAARGLNKALAVIMVPAIGKMINDAIDQALADNAPRLNELNHTNTPDQLGRSAREWWDRNIQGGTGVDPRPSPLPQLGGGAPGTPSVGGIPIPGLVVPNANGPAPSAPFGNLPGQTPIEVSVQDRRGRNGTVGDGPAPAGNPILDPPGADGSGEKAKLPDAPVVPYDTTLPPGIPGMPADASVMGAENSFLDARHSLAEKRARLTQLEQSGVATEDDIQKARNDVLDSERGFQAAELRLNEARQNQYEQMVKAGEKQLKGLQGLSSSLGEFGAALDQDLGISKGLSGIAENLFKFLANLAAAPLLGQLGAIAEANPSKGGYGLMGIMGAQGAFGPQFTGIDYSKYGYGGSSAMGPYAFGGQMGGGYPGDAALLANVPAGRYTQDQRGDLTQGLADCSSAVEDLVNLMDGRPTSGASMYTGNAAEWLTQRGFLPGMGGPGDFRVGFNSSHMQATLPGGTPFNWGSDAAAARRGIGGTGADDPAFTSHYYRPAGGVPTQASVPGWTPSNESGYAGTAPVASPSGIYSPANTNPALNNPPAPGAGTGPAPGPVPAPVGGGTLPFMGAGAPQAAPFASTRYGGVEPSAGMGGGGLGITQGGMVDTAIGMAASGLDLMAPGAGQAAQTGIKLANRAIEYGGQVAGIGVQGLMDTFLPTGGSELANNSWFTRILGGLAGAAPALPNTAGGKGGQGGQPEPPLQGNGVDPNTTQHGQGGNTTNITVNNQRATEDGTGRDIAYHQQNQYSAPGM